MFPPPDLKVRGGWGGWVGWLECRAEQLVGPTGNVPPADLGAEYRPQATGRRLPAATSHNGVAHQDTQHGDLRVGAQHGEAGVDALRSK